jgi:phage major head subunit gpT-like protein
MGFRPRWFMSKRSDTAGNDWVIMDTSRDIYNVANQQLYANLNLATETNVVYETDFLSNGLKIRTSTASRNASGSTYIYMAFAEAPFKYANAR